MSPLQAGDRLDHYRLDECVADGGMATVFRATDLRVGSQVAIKVPNPVAECDPSLFTRFQREAEIGRTMDHPGVVRVFPAEKSWRVYFVMEWVEGTPLRVLLTRDHPLEPGRAIRIATAVCDALDHIHSRGVVHRDVKPENIIIGTGDRIKLIGAAAPASATAPGSPGTAASRGTAPAWRRWRRTRISGCADCGSRWTWAGSSNPDGVINQVEGGAVQSASWTLREQVRFDRDQITSAGWDSYPILRFTETPEVTVHIVDAPGEAEVGAGEVAQGPVAGAIGNAVANAVGVRVRDLPLTRERVARAIQES